MIPPVAVPDEMKPLIFVENVSTIVETFDMISVVYGVVALPTSEAPLDSALT